MIVVIPEVFAILLFIILLLIDSTNLEFEYSIPKLSIFIISKNLNMKILNFSCSIAPQQLEKYIKLPLDEKIELSNQVISKFCDENPVEQIYISSSFGKDSVVLIELVRRLYPDIPCVYVDTGIEPPSCVELSEIYDNVITLYPKKDIVQVTNEYGYMIPLGKDKASAIEQVRRNLHDEKFDTWRVKQMQGKRERAMWDYSDCTQYLVAPFKISDKCCYWLKKSPINSFMNTTQYKYSFTGITVEESVHRMNSILKNGFINKNRCSPIAHWTVNDVLKFIHENNLPLPHCYGEIEIDDDGNYSTTLFQRNGCLCCPVGAHLESPNKFQLLRDFDKDTWDFVINELGYGKVLDYFNIPYTWDE